MNTHTQKPAVTTQGKAIAEKQDEGGWLVMLPDGEVVHRNSIAAVERTVRRYAANHADANAINALEVEWRGRG